MRALRALVAWRMKNFSSASNKKGAPADAPPGLPVTKPNPRRRPGRWPRTRRWDIRRFAFGGAEGVGARAVRLEFPAHEARARKPAAQFGDHFWRGDQFDEQLARPGGNFMAGLDFGELAGCVGRENPSEREIAYRRRVKNRIHAFGDTAFSSAQIRGGGESLHPLGAALAGIRGGFGRRAAMTVWPRAARKLASSVPRRPVEKLVSRRTSSSGS